MTAPPEIRLATGRRLRAARLGRGMSVRRLAALVHLSPATISAIETGRTSVTLERLLSLTSVLGSDAADVLTDLQPPASATAHPSWREFLPITSDPALVGAARAFVETGYHGATVRAMAHAGGISPGAIYHRYAGKQALLQELMVLGMQDLLWRVRAAAQETTDPRRRLFLVVEANALWHVRRHDYATIGASEMRSLDATGHRVVAGARRQVQHLLDETAAEVGRDHGIDPGDTQQAARAIASLCTSIPRWYRPDGRLGPEEIARQQARFALRLIGVGEHPGGLALPDLEHDAEAARR